jgi:hypothetical protein
MGATTVELTGQGEPHGEPEELEREVEDIRENIDELVTELDRRGQELLDWRSQLRKHKLLLLAVGASCLVGLSLTLALGAAKRRRRNRFFAKAGRLREALARMVAHPELVAQPQPGIGKKALTAAVSAGVGALAKTLARQLAEAPEPARLAPDSE